MWLTTVRSIPSLRLSFSVVVVVAAMREKEREGRGGEKGGVMWKGPEERERGWATLHLVSIKCPFQFQLNVAIYDKSHQTIPLRVDNEPLGKVCF